MKITVNIDIDKVRCVLHRNGKILDMRLRSDVTDEMIAKEVVQDIENYILSSDWFRESIYNDRYASLMETHYE